MNNVYHLSVPAIQKMFVLQDEVNTLIDPEWKTRGRLWHVAVIKELSECLDHVPWEWWKKRTSIDTKSMIEQIKLEVIDTLHFAIAAMIETNIPPSKFAFFFNAGAEFKEIFKDNIDELSSYIVDVIKETLKSINGYAAGIGALCAYLGINADDVYRTYVAKNTLNIHRQLGGYKIGTYKKIWAGREDNVHLSELIAELNHVENDEFPSALASALKKREQECHG